MRRRKFTRGLAGAAAWQVIVGEARSQQGAVPVGEISGWPRVDAWQTPQVRTARLTKGRNAHVFFLQHWYRHGGTTC
jgi:hypothetical protein